MSTMIAMIPKKGATVRLFLVRRMGALEKVFTSEEQAVEYMKANRENGEFWRIHATNTEPHEVQP